MEVEHEEPRRHGFFFDEQSFRRDLYRLLCCFFSSFSFAEHRTDGAYDPVGHLQGDFEEFEISRLLVNIAVTARIIDDRDEKVSARFKTACGTLIADLTAPTNEEPLSLREAFNKIIHASRFNFDMEEDDFGDHHLVQFKQWLLPKIHLYGAKGPAEWKASLDIVKFVEGSAALYHG